MIEKKTLLFSITFLLLGFCVGFYVSYSSTDTPLGYKEKHSGQNRLTNKLLDFDIPPSNELGDYKKVLNQTIDAKLQQKNATEIGVYYRDLNNGPWVGVNEEEKFIPASLLKMPLMMTYYKKAETDRSILEKKYKYTKNPNGIVSTMNYSSKAALKDGSEYHVKELINSMIIHSDNDALFILAANADLEEQSQLFAELGFPIPENVTSTNEFISSRNMGSFFRVLYNATYLNEKMSEQALQLLTKTAFNEGIIAGLPKKLVVAHKYGEREESGIRELHDCGIIYLPKHPYILCIMTKGTSYKDLSNTIRDISKLTYEYVAKSNP